MKKIQALLKSIVEKFNIVAAVAYFLIVLMVVGNILLRFIFHKPLLGTYEVVCYCTLIAVSIGLPHCTMNDGHVRVTFFLDLLPAKINKIFYYFSELVITVGTAILGWKIFGQVLAQYKGGDLSPVLHIPFYILTAIIVLGFLFMFFVLVLRLIRMFMGESDKDLAVSDIKADI
ncbi:MAG: TRAP transporter small permease [Peptococcaceae bacterium]|nr:TRAP transporter small permease [Peptococcaceae bacterium]